jgi:hypothetical protein
VGLAARRWGGHEGKQCFVASLDPDGLFGDTPQRFRDSGGTTTDDLRAVSFPLIRPQNGVVMSMRPRPWPDVPELTAMVAHASFPKGNLAMRIRDELGEVYADEQFAPAFGGRGRPGISPAQLMMATILGVFGELDRPPGRRGDP